MTDMNYFDKSRKPHKVGEVQFSDQHVVLRFNIEDRPVVNDLYIRKLVRYNQMIDDVMEELEERRRETRMMEQTNSKRRMLWAFRKPNVQNAARYFNDFGRLEETLENLVINRHNIVTDFHEQSIRFYNDQTVQKKKFEPDDAAKADDLVVLTGVAEAARQITHETIRTWDWFGLGRSDIPADFDNQDLFSPIGRYFIRTHGTFGAIGEVIRLLVVSPDDMATEDISELIVADQQVGGNILFRSVLDKKIHHEANQHFLATSANIYLASRM